MQSRTALAAALVTLSVSCELDRAGEAPVPDSSPDLGASDENANDASLPGAMFSGKPSDGLADDSDAPAVAARDMRDAAEEDTSHDGSVPASPAVAGGDGGADAGTACARLMLCCPRLLVAPPLAFVCLAGSMQDGGEVDCETSLASLVDAGICP